MHLVYQKNGSAEIPGQHPEKNRLRDQTAARPTSDQRAIKPKNAFEGRIAMAFRESCYGTIVPDCRSPAL
jgi:hypothetical protein